ncbi:hypothetical protein G4B88_006056 [Cannabis sativa]|uniref:Potassium transporter n=1 Tax=Cannabis sativa TaxID=3483 RepID=A0A7J6ID94_CANSA|nr:hypothetical protein G4B88_006056 [Cannabis sativa]
MAMAGDHKGEDAEAFSNNNNEQPIPVPVPMKDRKPSTFSKGTIHDQDDILGVLSLIIYTIALIPMLKYVFIVLWANDNGDGGTFALYSLLCRYAKVSLVPNYQPEDRELSNYKLETPSNQLKRAHKIKEMLETSKFAKLFLFTVTIMGTSMVIGDGILTPSISVLSAVSGIKSLGQNVVVGISVVILIILFSVQRLGTDKVGSSFAPIIFVWFSLLTGIGLYNLFKHDIGVLRAFNPQYIVEYFKRNGRDGWVSLGGIFLCITGSEAMFADLAFPALLTAYAGQAAYLRKFPHEVEDTFYKSIPGPLYWPVFVVAVAASIIASQAMITGAFSIISQSLSLGCFPRVKVVHTSSKYEGQVYIPEINYLLMIACVIVTAALKTTENIGHAYGKKDLNLNMYRSGYCNGADHLFCNSNNASDMEDKHMANRSLLRVMAIWHYVHKQRYIFELKNKVSTDYLKELAANPNISRVPGMGLLYSELVQGIPPIFTHFINNIPSIHSVLVFVSIKNIPISKVIPEERFLFRQVEPSEYRMFRCVVRYGYNDIIGEPKEFELQLVENLKEFIRQQNFLIEATTADVDTTTTVMPDTSSTAIASNKKTKRSSTSTIHIEEGLGATPSIDRVSLASTTPSFNNKSSNSSSRIVSAPLRGAEEEMQFVQHAMDKGVVYLLGEAEVVAAHRSSFLKKMVVNYGYSFLRKNFRQGEKVMSIPSTRLLRVGMTYEI